MDISIAELKKDVLNLFKVVERQDEDNKSLTSLAESVTIMVKEMEYMRNDINDIKDENKSIRKELREHQDEYINKKLNRTNFIEEKIVGWVIVYILAGVSLYFLGKW